MDKDKCENCAKAKELKEHMLKTRESVFDAIMDYNNALEDCKETCSYKEGETIGR